VALPTRSSLNSNAHHALLAFLEIEGKVGAKLPTERRLSEVCDASRTTIRRILGTLQRVGLLGRKTEAGLYLVRKPRKKDYLPTASMVSRREGVEQSLLDMLTSGRLKPGEFFSELALAKRHGVTTGTVREALLSLSRLGVFTKQARKQWRVVEIDREMINELMDLRVLLELFALKQHLSRRDKTVDTVFLKIHHETKSLIKSVKFERRAFFRLDRQFHETILKGAGNRFLKDYSQHITLPIHLQFLHRGFDEGTLRLGVSQHLVILEAIERGDSKNALGHLEHHLSSARQTLLDLKASRRVAPKSKK
jgi:DNA-binding GntR family transcriptional regulator